MDVPNIKFYSPDDLELSHSDYNKETGKDSLYNRKERRHSGQLLSIKRVLKDLRTRSTDDVRKLALNNQHSKSRHDSERSAHLPDGSRLGHSSTSTYQVPSIRHSRSVEILDASSKPIYMKKSGPDWKGGSAAAHSCSPMMPRRMGAEGYPDSSANAGGGGSSSGSSAGRLRASGGHATSTGGSDGFHSGQEEDVVEGLQASMLYTPTANGSPALDSTMDQVDASENHLERTRLEIDHLKKKIFKTMQSIKTEQTAKEDNVNEYLRLSVNADKQQAQRIKTVFEKRNQKSTAYIASLQRKLEGYNRRLKEVETYGASGHKQAKEVLRDMGQGLKGVVDNIRGAKETIVSKPKEVVNLFKNRFGSADNINSLKPDEGQITNEDTDKLVVKPTGGTLPASVSSNFKYQSDQDDQSSVTSGSAPASGGTHSSPHPTLSQRGCLSSDIAALEERYALYPPPKDYDPIIKELRDTQIAYYEEFSEDIRKLKDSVKNQETNFESAILDKQYQLKNLEAVYNDLTELQQNEVSNVKQDIRSMEEKVRYQMEERLRDMQELLESCQTRITKMELQQQQQQLISMEGIENSNFRALLTKVINVVLALLAVILVFVSTVANFLGPFLTSRLRILSTILLVAVIVATWRNWSLVEDFILAASSKIKGNVAPHTEH